jgi:predicted Kef-type K+ transport protein
MDAVLLAVGLFAIVALPVLWPDLDRYRRKLKTRRARARRSAREE